ncbi:hypothetical protein F0562_002311 [Nyssa sinensis]|uniref:Uncharacterized protein n=1 Tax=Nyssa sinensis TaxID=561372 RepID=A0A5J5C9B1_9ASTE|nr:hypothetical protein F0562_002311 [Nyssa sinensis]
MLRRARDSNLGTVVVGDWHRALGRHADLWVPWIEVENGEISEEDLVPRSRRRSEFIGRDDGTFSITHFDEEINGEENLDSIMDELVMVRTDFNAVRISAFSEREEEEEEDWMGEEMNRKRNVQLQMGQSLDDDDFSLDSEDEESETEEDDMVKVKESQHFALEMVYLMVVMEVLELAKVVVLALVVVRAVVFTEKDDFL